MESIVDDPLPRCCSIADVEKSNFLQESLRLRTLSTRIVIRTPHLTDSGRSCGVRCTVRDAQKGMEVETREDCQLPESSVASWRGCCAAAFISRNDMSGRAAGAALAAMLAGGPRSAGECILMIF